MPPTPQGAICFGRWWRKNGCLARRLGHGSLSSTSDEFLARRRLIDAYRQRFIELMVRFEVIRFGEFTLKSGRRSPYFVNAGRFRTGRALSGLGAAYAARIRAAGLSPDTVFGPAYKGVPLSVATAIALSGADKDIGFCFDRKETKDHGEGGEFVGDIPRDGQRIVIVDDVITAGGSVRESVQKLRSAARVEIVAAVVAVDREEQGVGAHSTLTELASETGFPVLSIVTVREVFDYLREHEVDGKRWVDAERRSRFEAYFNEFGVAVEPSSGEP